DARHPFRFSEDVVDLQPRAIVLLAGTNDLSAYAEPVHIEANLAAIIALARAENPAVPIVLCTIPPRDNPQYPTPPAAINARIAKLGASLDHTAVLDLFSWLSAPDGQFRA